MKFDLLFRWRERITDRSRWRLTRFLSAAILLAGVNVAHANGVVNLVTNGDFGTSNSCASITRSGVNGFDPASPLVDTWIDNNEWQIADDTGFDGGPSDNCYAFFDPGAGNAYSRGRLIQGFAAPPKTGLYRLQFQYIYEGGVINKNDPFFWVLGVNSSDPVISRFSTGSDGFPTGGTPADISNWDVLYQEKLAGQCTLTDCPDGLLPPNTGVSGTPVSRNVLFPVPADYDFWVVVVSYGCNDNSATQDCPGTLRALDNVFITVEDPDEEGPYTKNVAGVPNASIFDTTFDIGANVDDTNKGNSNIASAQFRITNLNGGGLVEDWTEMIAADSSFDSPIEDVTYEYSGGLQVGDYEICVRGYDAGGNEGNTSCSRFVTYDPFGGDGISFQLSNECAQFYTLENEGAENEITTLHYGENIVFDTDFRTNLNLTVSDSGNVNFAFSLKGNGQGYGVTSAILYNFKLNSVLRAKTDLSDFDPTIFTFKVKARIVGQAQEVDGYGILNGAQNNAELFFTLRIHYANGRYSTQAYDFGVECAGDPWANLMESKDLVTKEPVERGFGDENEKYGWSGADFSDSLVVGTKSAYYNLLYYINGDGGSISACINNNPGSLPDLYWRFVCLETSGNPNAADANGAELWNYSYKNKRWFQAYDAEQDRTLGALGNDYVQGFRAMQVYDGKLYAAGDLGASLSGLSYVNAGYFPGVVLFESEDGINFTEVECPAALCDGSYNPSGVNTSIRSMAVWDGRLWIGTFNLSGGQIWTYDGSTFDPVWPAAPDPTTPTVLELQPYGDYLYVALSGDITYDDAPSNDYLYRCEKNCVDSGSGIAALEVVPGLPDIDPDTLTIIEMFTGVDKLFIGTINFEHGATLVSYGEDSDVWDVIVDGFPDGGMFDEDNLYFWAGAAIDHKVCVGTFNPDIISEIPRGGAELHCSEDGVDWRQEPLPIGWSVLGYGIREIVVGDRGKTMFVLSATNLLAPDLIPFDNPLRAGLEVWAIRDVKIDKPGGGKRGRKK